MEVTRTAFRDISLKIRALREELEEASSGRDADDLLHIEKIDSGLCRAEIHSEILAKTDLNETKRK